MRLFDSHDRALIPTYDHRISPRNYHPVDVGREIEKKSRNDSQNPNFPAPKQQQLHISISASTLTSQQANHANFIPYEVTT